MKTIMHSIGTVFILLLFVSFSSNANQIEGKAKKPGWIGVMVQDLNEKLARKAKLESTDGAYVKEVLEGSPADSAGILEGDVIIEFNGKKIYDTDDLIKAVRRTKPSAKVNLIVIREGKKITISLTVGRAKTPKYSRFGMMPNIPEISVHINRNIIGLKLITLNEQLAEYFGAPNNEGVLVEEVEKDSEAEKAGFKAGDVIIRIGKKSVDDVEKIKREVKKYDEGEKVEFEVIRKGSKKILKLEIEAKPERHEMFFRKFQKDRFRLNPFEGSGAELEIEKILPGLETIDLRIESI